MATLLAFADDLSGAAETASALRMRGARSEAAGSESVVTLVLSADDLSADHPRGDDPTGCMATTPERADAIVIDTDTRSLDAQDAERRTRESVRRVTADHPGARIVKKVDSLLRGHLAAELAPFIELHRSAGIVLCPALPVLGRTVVGGAVIVNGASLATVDAWRLQDRAAPATVADAIAPLTASVIDLATIRSTSDALAAAVAPAIERGHIVVCDAETDDDLARIVQAAWDLDGPPAVLAGSSAIAGAAAEWMRHRAGGLDTRVPRYSTTGTLVPRYSASEAALVVVAGTPEPGIRKQLARIAEHGATVLTVAPLELLDAPHSVAASIARHAADGACVAVTIEGPRVPDAGWAAGRELSRALASAVAEGCGDADLVLTGGETARRVLDALGIESLSLGEPVMRESGTDQSSTDQSSTNQSSTDQSSTEEHGAVRMHTPDGRVIVTRPGSFGDDDSLLTIIRAMRPGNFRSIRSIRQSKGTS